MDSDEAIRLLKVGPDGVREWNERRQRGEEIPDLTVANLRGANLRGAFLSGVCLRGADLRGADLRGADLRRADLRRADLREADLREADLSGAVLRGAVLRGAKCLVTVFGDIDLSEVNGLESIGHWGPSTVGVDTLVRSRGHIPEAFLRGCGVPETWITFLPSLIGGMEPIEFYSCFISYSTKDQDFAERLHSRLREKGLRVWLSPADARWGKRHYEQIDEAIRVHDKLLLILSPESLASGWVRTEIRKARKAEIKEGRRKLFPIRLVPIEAIKSWECVDPRTGQDFAEEVLRYRIPDFSDWKDHEAFEAAFARLIRDLKAIESTGEGVGRKGPPPRE